MYPYFIGGYERRIFSGRVLHIVISVVRVSVCRHNYTKIAKVKINKN